LSDGLTLVRSPKGTGKTAGVANLIRGAGRVILIGHRRSLIRQSCARLDLRCYLDDQKGGRGAQDRYGVCLDSLGKISGGSRHDVIVLDESEQLLAHFLSDTIDRREGGGRDRLFQDFAIMLRRAKKVVALDADLGWITFATLTRMLPGVPVHLWMNDATPGEDRVVEVYQSKEHLVAELMQAVADGKRCFVTSNSKALVETIASALAREFSNRSQIVITADTAGARRVQTVPERPGRQRA
jgi:hypothetical protein